MVSNMRRRKLPTGIQNFREIREQDCQANDDVETRLALAFALYHVGRTEEAKQLAAAELPHPDAEQILAASGATPLPLFAAQSPWWLPSEVR